MKKSKDKKFKRYFSSNKKTKIIDLNENKDHGAQKCDNCGSTSFSHDIETGKLICDFCKKEVVNQEIPDLLGGVSKLEGKTISEGSNIIDDKNGLITLKCSGCGAQIIINTEETLHFKCHWCRTIVSINDQIENGAVPDIILPFKIEKEDAQNNINQFINKRAFFANSKFKKEFTVENIRGVYLPYYVVDINGHIKFEGKGEIHEKTYNKNAKIYYDAKSYDITREFDIEIDNLTFESSIDKLDYLEQEKSNEIINSIMPFDIENSVKWNANYLKGHSSEKRDLDVGNVNDFAKQQSIDVAKHLMKSSIIQYDRGVSWKKIDLEIKGEKWIAALLPVWMYSFKEKIGQEEKLHYIVVNGRTGETMGSVPIEKSKLIILSMLLEVIAIILFILLFKGDVIAGGIGVIFAILGVGLYTKINGKYGNYGVRHLYEKETKARFKNFENKDKLIRTKYGILNKQIEFQNSRILNNREYLDKKYRLYSKIKKEDTILKKVDETINEFKNKL